MERHSCSAVSGARHDSAMTSQDGQQDDRVTPGPRHPNTPRRGGRGANCHVSASRAASPASPLLSWYHWLNSSSRARSCPNMPSSSTISHSCTGSHRTAPSSDRPGTQARSRGTAACQSTRLALGATSALLREPASGEPGGRAATVKERLHRTGKARRSRRTHPRRGPPPRCLRGARARQAPPERPAARRAGGYRRCGQCGRAPGR